MEKIITVLLECRLFSGLNRAELISLLNTLEYKTHTYKKGDYLMRMDKPYPYISVILNGTVEIHKQLTNGNRLCIEIRDSGEMFGGAVVFAPDGKETGCEIIARSAGSLFQVSKSNVNKMLAECPRVGQNLNMIFSERVITFQKKMELLSYSSIKQKIAFYCRNFIKPDKDGIMQLPFSKSKWAEVMNISRPSLMRELKSLEDEKSLIINNDRTISLDNSQIDKYL